MSKHWTIISKRDGEIVNKKALKTLFDSLRNGKWTVEINSADQRSGQQNRYYWGIVIPVVQRGVKHLGTELTSEETHEFLKARFNKMELVNRETGQCEEIPLSTTRLNKEEFGEYIEKIQQFAAEFLGVVIPDPGEQLKAFSE